MFHGMVVWFVGGHLWFGSSGHLGLTVLCLTRFSLVDLSSSTHRRFCSCANSTHFLLCCRNKAGKKPLRQAKNLLCGTVFMGGHSELTAITLVFWLDGGTSQIKDYIEQVKSFLGEGGLTEGNS